MEDRRRGDPTPDNLSLESSLRSSREQQRVQWARDSGLDRESGGTELRCHSCGNQVSLVESLHPHDVFCPICGKSYGQEPREIEAGPVKVARLTLEALFFFISFGGVGIIIAIGLALK